MVSCIHTMRKLESFSGILECTVYWFLVMPATNLAFSSSRWGFLPIVVLKLTVLLLHVSAYSVLSICMPHRFLQRNCYFQQHFFKIHVLDDVLLLVNHQDSSQHNGKALQAQYIECGLVWSNRALDFSRLSCCKFLSECAYSQWYYSFLKVDFLDFQKESTYTQQTSPRCLLYTIENHSVCLLMFGFFSTRLLELYLHIIRNV